MNTTIKVRRTKARFLAVTAALALLGVLSTVSPANAARGPRRNSYTVQCGQVFSLTGAPNPNPQGGPDIPPTPDNITIRLTGDVVCSGDSDGIVIGDPRLEDLHPGTDAPTQGFTGFTLDLNGYSIRNEGNVPDGQNAGVNVLGSNFDGMYGQSGVIITNSDPDRPSVISGFDAGVALTGGGTHNGHEPNVVSHLTVSGNIGSFQGLGDGILIQSQGTQVFNNTVTNNGPNSGISVIQGIEPEVNTQGTNVQIHDNVVDGNNFFPQCQIGERCNSQDTGIRLEQHTRNNDVYANTVTNNGLDGIALFPGTRDNRVYDNKVHGNGLPHNLRRTGDGIHLFGAVQHTPGATGNTIGFFGDQVVTLNEGNGIALAHGATGNTVQRNTVRDNNRSPGDPAHFDALDENPVDPPAWCTANVWQLNDLGTKNPPCLQQPPPP